VMVPTMSPQVRRNKHGNMSPGQYTQILTDLAGGMSSAGLLDFDQMGMRHEKGRLKRKAQDERNKEKGRKARKRDSGYFYMNPRSPQIVGSEKGKGKGLRNKSGGIFFRTAAGSLHRIMTQTAMSTVPFKFDFYAVAEDSVHDVFERELIKRLKR